MKTVFAICLLLCTCILYGQQPYFFRTGTPHQEHLFGISEYGQGYVLAGSFIDSGNAGYPASYFVRMDLSGKVMASNKIEHDRFTVIQSVYRNKLGFIALGYEEGYPDSLPLNLVVLQLDAGLNRLWTDRKPTRSNFQAGPLYFKSRLEQGMIYGIFSIGHQTSYFRCDAEQGTLTVVNGPGADYTTDILKRPDETYIGFVENTDSDIVYGYRYLDSGFNQVGFAVTDRLGGTDAYPLQSDFTAKAGTNGFFYSGAIKGYGGGFFPVRYALQKHRLTDVVISREVLVTPDSLHALEFNTPIRRTAITRKSLDFRDPDNLYVALVFDYSMSSGNERDRKNLYVANFDADLNQRWEVTLEQPDTLARWLRIDDLLATADGGCLIVTDDGNDAFVLKFDKQGGMTGLCEVNDAAAHGIYPNPFQETLHVKPGRGTFYLYDPAGRQVHCSETDGGEVFADVPPGTYVYRIVYADGKAWSGRLVRR